MSFGFHRKGREGFKITQSPNYPIPSPVSMTQNRVGRFVNRLIFFLNPERFPFCAIVNPDHNDYSGGCDVAPFRRIGGTLHMVGGDLAVIAARSIIQAELAESLSRVLVRMLLPIRIGHVNSVGSLHIISLNCLKEFVDHSLVGPKTKEKPENSGEYDNQSRNHDQPLAALRRPRIIFLGIHQSHWAFPLNNTNKNLEPTIQQAFGTQQSALQFARLFGLKGNCIVGMVSVQNLFGHEYTRMNTNQKLSL